MDSPAPSLLFPGHTYPPLPSTTPSSSSWSLPASCDRFLASDAAQLTLEEWCGAGHAARARMCSDSGVLVARLTSYARHVVARQRAGELRFGDGSDDTLMLSASQLVRAEDGCESSQELQVRAWHTQRPPVRDKLQPCV